MKKKNSRPFVALITGLIFLGLIVIFVAIASIFAYRYFIDIVSFRPLTYSFRFNQADVIRAPEIGRGVVVTGVDNGSPASTAGIEEGYVILAVNGRKVDSVAELQSQIQQYKVGDTITLTVDNGIRQEDISVTLESAGPFLGVGVSNDFDRAGQGDLRINPFPESINPFDRFNDGFREGSPRFGPQEHLFPFDNFPGIPDSIGIPVIILDVVPGSPAEDFGIHPGTIVHEVDGASINDPDQLTNLIRQMKPGDMVSLTIESDGSIETVEIRLASHPDNSEIAYLGVYLGPKMRDFREHLPRNEFRSG